MDAEKPIGQLMGSSDPFPTVTSPTADRSKIQVMLGFIRRYFKIPSDAPFAWAFYIALSPILAAVVIFVLFRLSESLVRQNSVYFIVALLVIVLLPIFISIIQITVNVVRLFKNGLSLNIKKLVVNILFALLSFLVILFYLEMFSIITGWTFRDLVNPGKQTQPYQLQIPIKHEGVLKEPLKNQIIHYSEAEIKEVLLASKKYYDSEGDPLSYIDLFAEKCSPVISEYVYTFPGYKYPLFYSYIAFEQNSAYRPSGSNGLHSITLQAIVDPSDNGPENSSDDYNFYFDFDKSTGSCELLEGNNTFRNPDITRHFFPAEAKDFLLKQILSLDQVKQLINNSQYIVNYSVWNYFPTEDQYLDPEEISWLKSLEGDLYLATINFKFEDETYFYVEIHLPSGRVYISEKKYPPPLL